MYRESNGMKSEVRNPKAERRPKPEIRTGVASVAACSVRALSATRECSTLRRSTLPRFTVGFSDFGLRPSFGLRISDFGINS